MRYDFISWFDYVNLSNINRHTAVENFQDIISQREDFDVIEDNSLREIHNNMYNSTLVINDLIYNNPTSECAVSVFLKDKKNDILSTDSDYLYKQIEMDNSILFVYKYEFLNRIEHDKHYKYEFLANLINLRQRHLVEKYTFNNRMYKLYLKLFLNGYRRITDD